MKQNIAFIWADALESGNYQQGRARLRYQNKFCCLGVLTDIYLKEAGKFWLEDHGVYSLEDGTEYELSPDVLQWSGVRTDTANCDTFSLMSLNDTGRASFTEIAKAIRENWEKL